MQTKLSILTERAAAGDWRGALRIAARFQDLGDHRDAILRAHEAFTKAAFYRQLGKDPDALIAAGIAALRDRYRKQLDPMFSEGDTTMTDTNLTSLQISQLTAIIIGGGYKRANSKEAAIKRFTAALAEKKINISVDKVLAMPFDQATSHVRHMAGTPGLTAEDEAKIDDAAKATAIEIVRRREARRAAVAVAVAEEAVRIDDDAFKNSPAAQANVESWNAIPSVRRAKPPKADKPAAGKRAAVLAAAEAGELPAAPDFSAETHKRFRAKLAEVVALVEAGDIAGLEAYPIEPKSSSRAAICKYRDLAVVALKAKAAKKEAA